MTKIQSRNIRNKFKSTYDLSEKFNRNYSEIIRLGSDTHLDIISENTKQLNLLVSALAVLNDLIEKNFPQSIEEAELIKFNLHSLHSSLSLLIDNLQKNTLNQKSYKSSIDLLIDEDNQIIEYINDINEYVLSEDNSLTYLLKEL
ncbi:MAG: hypothetical protein LBP34_00600 [Flavobacteriaceae bacterium]|jgi:hypothetical protein|nr:hypothetical protein [Flavobacteriaceae bacterium]